MFKSLLGGGTGSKKESKVSAATKTFTTAATGRGQAGDDDKNHMMDHDVFLEDTDRMLAEMNAGMASLSSGGGGGGADDYDLHHLTQVEDIDPSLLGRNHHDDDAPVELTEDDLNDPDLLAQLAELTGGGGGGGLDGEGDDEDGKEPSPTAAKNPGIKPSSPSKSITTQISSSPSKSLASTISSSNHSSPVKSSQSPLLTPSPSTSGSSPAVRSASPIPVAPTPLKQAFQPQTAASPPKSSNPTSTNASKPITFESVKSTTPSAAAIAFTTNTSSSSLTVQAITDRQKELKDMAVLYKKANDTESAKNILVTAKSLEAWKDLLKKGKMQLPPSYKLPEVPPPPPIPTIVALHPTGSSKSTSSTSLLKTPSFLHRPKSPSASSSSSASINSHVSGNNTSSSSTSPAASLVLFDTLITKLDSQSKLCADLAAYHLKANQKDSAIQFHKMRKAFDTDIETIKALRTAAAAASASSNPTSITTTMPQFSYVPFTYEIEQTFMHIGVDELEVVVERAWQLGVVNGPGTREGWPKSADDTNSFVVVDLGWPLVDDGKVEGVGSNADSKFETGVVKLNANPEFHFTKKLKILRSSKSFQRYIDRKKMVIEVMHSNAVPKSLGFSLFGVGGSGASSSNSVCIGKVQIELKPLMTEAEIYQTVTLVDPGNRKPLPAQLEIRIRLQKPLTKVHVVKTTDERWLTVHFGGVGAPPPAASSVSPAAPATVASPPQNVGVANNHGSLAKPSVSLTGKPPSAAVSVENTPTANAADLEAMETEFENIENLFSMMAVQFEFDDVSAAIAALETQGHSIPEEMTIKKDDCELRMNTVPTMIQAGMLTEEGYVAKIKQSIDRHKTMALAFKRGGKIDLAKRAMIRMTKMQEELKELVGDQPAATAAVAAPQPVPVVPTSAVQSSTAIVNAASPISAVVDQKASSPSPTESPVKAPTAGVIDAIEKMEFEMESPEVLYSMAVLMTEMEDCKAQIQAFKLKKQSVPDDLAMKPDSYQMRIDFLMTQINFNLITADVYELKCKESLERHKYMAKEFQKAGLTDFAKRALIRCKKMSEELAPPPQ